MKHTRNNTLCLPGRILILTLCLAALCCGSFSAAEDGGQSSVIVGNTRETVSLAGEWESFTDDASGGEIPQSVPETLVSGGTVSLPSYSALPEGETRIWYRKTISLANPPAEVVLLDFGSSQGAAAVYVNGALAGENIAPLLHTGENTIVLLEQTSDASVSGACFADRIELVFSSAPAIVSVDSETDPEAGTVSFALSLFNPREEDVKTDVSITVYDPDGAEKGSFLLEGIDILAGGNTTANVSGIEIEDFTEKNVWTAENPYVYTAEIVTSGDRITVPFALRGGQLFGTEGYRYGMDLIVSDFFANPKNSGYTWNREWINSFFELLKEIGWNVVAYRSGALPELWQETALYQGILLVDQNGNEEWAEAQDALWTQETDLAAKCEELKQNDADGVIVPVLYSAAEGLYSDAPAFSGVGKMRLKNIFTGTGASAPAEEAPQEEGNAFVRFFQGIVSYFKEMINKTFIRDNRYKLFLEGLGNTLLVAVASTGFGVIIGMLIAIVKVWNHQTILAKKKNPVLRFLNFLAEFYTTVIRGTPVVVQLLITYNVIFVFSDRAVLIGIFAFSINSGAYVSEIIRAGINSVDKGQTEAGRSLGLSQVTTMKSIVLPQAFKNILPALGNEFIAVLKETSVIGYLGVIDLTRAGELVRSRTADAFFTLLFVALIYLILVFGLSAVFKRFERRLNRSDRN